LAVSEATVPGQPRIAALVLGRVPGQERVQDALGVLAVERAAEQGTSVDRADEDLGRDRGASLRTEISSCDAAIDHAANLTESGIDDAGAERFADGRGASDLAKQPADDQAKVGSVRREITSVATAINS
jgi:hypothetical protein